MKNPNSPMNRAKRGILGRWSAEDYPGADPRFQIRLFAKDLAVFVLFPIVVLFAARSFESGSAPKKKAQQDYKRDLARGEQFKSQIIEFDHRGKAGEKTIDSKFGVLRKAPGALVRIKLLNLVETYSTAPVHAQIVDGGLGNSLLGGVLIGDATPDPSFDRINITFRFVRDPGRENIAIPIAARALGLDGTLGLIAAKKEGFFARSAFSSAATTQDSGSGNADLKEVLFRALTVGLVQEYSKTAQVERNRSQVLALQPSAEFFAELTDFFPGGLK